MARFAGDTPVNLLSSPFDSVEFKTKANLSVSWALDRFEGTVYVDHYGKTPNYLAQLDVAGYATPGAGDVGTWTVANLGAQYTLKLGLEVSGNINNVFNTMPPADNAQPGASNQPFNVFNYNNCGRSYFVGVNCKFGR